VITSRASPRDVAALRTGSVTGVEHELRQAVSNSPLAIFTLASSSVRAVNLRTRPVALCRTVHMIGGPFSAALRDKNRRTLSKRLPDVTAFRDTSSHSANASGMVSPQAKAARPFAARSYAYAEPSICPDYDRRISLNSFSSFSRAAKSAADGANVGEPETAPSAGESGFGLSSGKSRTYLLLSSMGLSFTSNRVPREGRPGGDRKSSASCLVPPNFPAGVALWTWYSADSSE
jgi:hypothetical protein